MERPVGYWSTVACGSLVTIVAGMALSGCVTAPGQSLQARPSQGLGTTEGTAGASIAKEASCTACHRVDQRHIGPSFQDIAARYKGNPKAIDLLSDRVRSGSVGNWGQIPKPANRSISESDARTVVSWILGANTAAQPRADDLRTQCRSYGFEPASQGMANCVMKLDQLARQADLANRQRAEQQSKCEAVKWNAFRASQTGNFVDATQRGGEAYAACMAGLPTPRGPARFSCSRSGPNDIYCTEQ